MLQINPVNIGYNPHIQQRKNQIAKNQTCESADFQQFYYVPIQSKEKMLEDYGIAKNYFEKNCANHKPIMGNIDDLKLLESNQNVKRNFCKFLVEKSDKELKRLQSLKHLSVEQQQELEGYSQINKFFKEYLKLLPAKKTSKNVNFCAKIKPEDEKYCKQMVHGYAGACSLISAGAGAFSLGNVDTPLLRTLQGGMFIGLMNQLNVPFFASAEYVAKEMYSGAIIGVEGAKILTSLMGMGAHAASALSGASAATGGASHAAISSGAAAIHGSLSFLITEKMGLGYITRVKNDRMNILAQSIELASFLSVRAIYGGIDGIFDTDWGVSVEDACNPENIKCAYEALPTEKKEFLASCMDVLKDYNLHRFGTSFIFNFSLMTLADYKNATSKEALKAHLKKAFENAFIVTSVYEMLDIGVGEAASINAKETVQDMKDNLDKYPKVFDVMKNAEQDFFNKIDIDKLDSNAFQDKFTNKPFLSTFAFSINEQIRDFIREYRHRKDSEHQKKLDEINKDFDELIKKRQENENKDINSIIDSYKSSLEEHKNAFDQKNNFGFNRIAGYQKEKDLIITQFINPINSEKVLKDVYVPSGIVFYGPTNTGKTTFAQAIAEQGLCKMERLALSFNEEKMLAQIKRIKENAVKRFDEKKQRTIIKIDEIDGLSNKPKVIKELQSIVDDENSKISIIGTTNYFEKVDKNLSSSFLKVRMAPAEKDDMKAILTHYSADNYPEEVEFLLSVFAENKNGKFSNKQLEDIAKQIDGNREKLQSIIEKYKPEIPDEE